MYCAQCGSELTSNAAFCATCGTKVGDSGAVSGPAGSYDFGVQNPLEALVGGVWTTLDIKISGHGLFGRASMSTIKMKFNEDQSCTLIFAKGVGKGQPASRGGRFDLGTWEIVHFNNFHFVVVTTQDGATWGGVAGPETGRTQAMYRMIPSRKDRSLWLLDINAWEDVQPDGSYLFFYKETDYELIP